MTRLEMDEIERIVVNREIERRRITEDFGLTEDAPYVWSAYAEWLAEVVK